MKVFMSWSGARSKAAAELLHDWIKCVVQASRPWISTRGIGRGAVWFTEINNELRDTSVGIICLTHQNKNAPWILFEAGALAKGLSTNKVCTFLVDLTPSDIQDPLAQFNHTLPSRDGMMSLAATLNSALDSPLDGATLSTVFDAFWPQFELRFAALLEQYPQEAVIEERSEASMLEEILDSTRNLTQRMRMLEDRQSNDVATSAGIRWQKQAPFSIEQLRGGDHLEQFPLSQAMSLITDMKVLGLGDDQIYKLIQNVAGKRRAKEIFESPAIGALLMEAANDGSRTPS